ncbi:MAG: carbohydrate ABC transporter permease [Clostridia bacterium]|nr:carbohydrate ABC transporter permease [Clostridia bacterium]
MKRKATIGDALIYAVLGFVTLITLYPLVNLLAVSLSPRADYLRNPMMLFPRRIELGAYRMVFGNRLMWSSYKNTVIITIGGTAISMFLTATMAYPLSEPGLKGKKWIMSLYLFTMFFGGGMIPNYYLVRSLGMLDSLWALMIPGALSVYNGVLMKNSFEGLPSSLKESARIDGASDLTVFVRIALPLSLPIMATITLFYAVGKWNSYFNAILYVSSRSKWTLQLLLREIISNTESLLDDGTTVESLPATSIRYATIVLATLPILLIYPFLQKYFVKGIMVGAVKG